MIDGLALKLAECEITYTRAMKRKGYRLSPIVVPTDGKRSWTRTQWKALDSVQRKVWNENAEKRKKACMDMLLYGNAYYII